MFIHGHNNIKQYCVQGLHKQQQYQKVMDF